ncbi:hypothetical protein WJX72_012047 [[Myrmecia] bisecta]|uniref:Rhodanese domain-containing protein n=1 Tax=[Myrmecia] bisecta TaxID=41462 RepID=A0AAW1Q225_9CHLO
MFEEIIADNSKRKAQLQKDSDAAKKEAIQASEELSAALVETVGAQVAKAYATQEKIGSELTAVRQLAAQAARQRQRWTSAVGKVNSALKEFGDYQNYLEVGAGADQAEVAVAVIRCVKSASRQIKGRLGKTWPLLARDLLALLSGLRRAIMVDYAPVAGVALCQLVEQICKVDTVTGKHLAVAELDGCCYVLRLDLCTHPGAAAGTGCAQPVPGFVAFQALDGQASMCRWATSHEAQAVMQQLDTVRSALQDAAASQPSGAPCCPHINLSRLPGIPIMPTLSGWLLGYPVVYLVDSDNVDLAARLLSSSALRLYKLQMTCKPLRDALVEHPGLSSVETAGLDTLCSFSLPSMLSMKGLAGPLKKHTGSMAQDLSYISAGDLVTVLQGPDKAKTLVVDVRDDDFEGGHIKGALNVPSGDFEAGIAPVVKNQLSGVETVVVHCALSQIRGPKCAVKLNNILDEAGLANRPQVKVLSKGFNGFQEAYGHSAEFVEKEN